MRWIGAVAHLALWVVNAMLKLIFFIGGMSAPEAKAAELSVMLKYDLAWVDEKTLTAGYFLVTGDGLSRLNSYIRSSERCVLSEVLDVWPAAGRTSFGYSLDRRATSLNGHPAGSRDWTSLKMLTSRRNLRLSTIVIEQERDHAPDQISVKFTSKGDTCAPSPKPY